MGLVTFNPFAHTPPLSTANFMVIDEIAFTPNTGIVCSGDFEEWINYAVESPDDWHYIKSILINPGDVEGSHRVLKAVHTTPDDYAVRLRSIPVAEIWSGADIATTNKDDFRSQVIPPFQVSNKYHSFNGYYKANIAPGDTASIRLELYSNGVYAGQAQLLASTSVNNYTPFDIVIGYVNDSLVPDSANIFMSTNWRDSFGATELFADKLGFDGFWGLTNDTLSISSPRPSQDEISIYPNPAKDNFIIEITPHLYASYHVLAKLMDINGREIKQIAFPPGQTRASIDISPLTAGIYFVKVIANEKVFSKKIVVLK